MEASGLAIGDSFLLCGLSWTVISRYTALCNTNIGTTGFNNPSPAGTSFFDSQLHGKCAYENSRVKKMLDDCAAKEGIVTADR
jgi:hypothetical protein